MEKNVFATLKTLPAIWHETGNTLVIPEVTLVAGPYGLFGKVDTEEGSKYIMLSPKHGHWPVVPLRFLIGKTFKNTIAFELKKEGTDETIWRLRKK